MDLAQQLEEKAKYLDDISELIDEESFDDWVNLPMTKFYLTSMELKILEKDIFLSDGNYIDKENGLVDAAKCMGAKVALQDMLEVEFTSEEEEDEG